MDTRQGHHTIFEHAQDNKAFTLMEIVLVLTLLGILTALAVPNLLPFNDRWLLRSTAHMIAGDIRHMQSLSVQECAEYNFEIHPSQFYYLTRKNEFDSGHFGKKVTLHPRITEITTTLRPSGYGGQIGGYCVLTYNCIGTPTNSGSIVLKTSSGSSIKITVEVATGRVHVYD